MKHGVCHLCGASTQLTKSHILPEFFYEDTYDEDGRFISISSHPRHRPRPMQIGLREPLLCELCEAHLSRYETYAAALLRRADAAAEVAVGGFRLPDVDLKTFRLFGLSLLWRAHIARAHMFSKVNLGPHAEPLRQMLLTENPGDPHQCGFALGKITGLETHGTMIVGPRLSRFMGHRAYLFTARGYEWVFIVSGTAKRLKAHFPFVGEHDELIVPFLPQDTRQLFAGLRRAFPQAFRAD